jgi:20S proteasome subunit beta 2
LIVSEEVRMTTGAGKTQEGVLDVSVPTGKGPGGEEGMEIDAQ